MKIYGYCRISTPKQSLERQIKNISAEYPTAEIIAETYSGTTTDRPQWNKLKRKVLKLLKQGEEIAIVFDSVSRMSRNAIEGFKEYKELFELGINLIFLKEHMIDTETYKQTMNKQLDVIVDTGDSDTDTLINTIIGAIQKYQLALAEKQIKLVFEQAEKEVLDLRKITSEGMKVSGAGEKIRKAKIGKTFETSKAKIAKKVIKQHSKTFGGSLNDAECIQLAGISHNTFYEYKRQIKAELLL